MQNPTICKKYKTLNEMKIKILKSINVTQTEKKHLKAFLQSGKTSAQVNTKIYTIIKGSPLKNGYEYKITIHTPYARESTKEKAFDKQTIILQYLNN